MNKGDVNRSGESAAKLANQIACIKYTLFCFNIIAWVSRERHQSAKWANLKSENFSFSWLVRRCSPSPFGYGPSLALGSGSKCSTSTRTTLARIYWLRPGHSSWSSRSLAVAAPSWSTRSHWCWWVLQASVVKYCEIKWHCGRQTKMSLR